MTVDEAADLICQEAVRNMHTEGLLTDSPSARLFTIGETSGLRTALCLLKGWDPVLEADKEGLADQCVKVWHNLPGHCGVSDCKPW